MTEKINVNFPNHFIAAYNDPCLAQFALGDSVHKIGYNDSITTNIGSMKISNIPKFQQAHSFTRETSKQQ